MTVAESRGVPSRGVPFRAVVVLSGAFGVHFIAYVFWAFDVPVSRLVRSFVVVEAVVFAGSWASGRVQQRIRRRR